MIRLLAAAAAVCSSAAAAAPTPAESPLPERICVEVGDARICGPLGAGEPRVFCLPVSAPVLVNGQELIAEGVTLCGLLLMPAKGGQ